MFTLCINTNADKDQLQYQSSSSLSTVSKNSHNLWIIFTQQRLYQSSSSLSLIVPVQVATTVVAMNTDHPEWILPITVDYLFESPQGKKSCNSFIFLSWSLWSSSSFLSSILRYRHHYHRHHHNYLFTEITVKLYQYHNGAPLENLNKHEFIGQSSFQLVLVYLCVVEWWILCYDDCFMIQ